jgi:O-methyltransferase domain/Dimerisation domain
MGGVDQGAASYQQMLGLVVGFWVSQIVRTAAALSVADRLAAGPMTARQLAAAEGSDPEATFRLLRACTSLKLVTYEPASGRFAGTALLDTLRRDSPHSLRNLALVQTAPGHWQSWGRFTDSVRAGATQFEAALGYRDIWAYFEQNPTEGQLFGAAMTDLSAPVVREAARVIDTTGVGLVADIGGANGAFVYELLARNDKLRGIVFDLPITLPGAQADAERLGLQDRSITLAGDFFEAVPVADMYLLKYILHDWDDEQCLQILNNVRAAMSPGARVIIVEMLVGESDDPGIGTLMDMNMLAMLHGRERDLTEFDTLLTTAGLRRTELTLLQPPYCVIEAVAR